VISALWLVAAGFFLGVRHATDADHVVAIATIVSRQKTIRDAVWVGVLWGIGHTLTVSLFGGVIILFGVVIPDRVGLAMQLVVAAMLVILGFATLAGTMTSARGDAALRAAHRRDMHAHAHVHGDYVHSHVHGHTPAGHGHADGETPQARLDRWFGRIGVYQALRPIVVGVVHGMAGSAAIALMVLAAIQDAWWAIAYLALFGLGTVAGMMLITAAIAAPFAYSAGRMPVFNRRLRVAAGLLSLVFGLGLMLHIGFVDGLFVDNPSRHAH
jgi:ABC-type nickel/cobalt efflux system permease component RcnA